jgi:hypothetical protein
MNFNIHRVLAKGGEGFNASTAEWFERSVSLRSFKAFVDSVFYE